MRHRLLVLAALALAASAVSSTAGAAPGGGLSLTPVKSTFPERTYILTLPGDFELTGKDVQILENGEEVAGLAVAPTSPTRSGSVLLVDASESMKGRPIEAAMDAARVFAGYRKPGQRLAVVTYNADTRILLPFTIEEGRIAEALATTPSVRYFTRMYDAVLRVARLAQEERLDSTAVVLLSDGQELASRATQDAAIAAANAAGVRIFSVALMSRYFDSTTLRTLAEKTGGAYLEARSPDALAGIYDRLGSRLANEYLVQYKSFAGPEEKIKVSVTVTGVDRAATASYTSPPLLTPPPAALDGSSAARAAESPLTMLFVAVLAAGLIGIAVTALVPPRPRALRRRLGAFVSLREEQPKRQTAALTERLLAGTEHSFGGTRWWDAFKHQLVVAQVPLPAEQVVVLTVIGTLFTGWLMYVLVGTAAAVLALGIPVIVRWLIRFRAERQRRLFGDQLADNLQVISSALRAGHSFVGALAVMVEEAPEPSRREFRRVVADEQLGVPLDDALHEVGERMRCPDLEQVAMVAALQRETGGNSADVLDQVAENIRQRAALRRLVRTLTAQGRMARWIVSALPVFILLMILMLNREYMDPLFSKTAGRVLLGVAAMMIVSGSLLIRRIVDIKV